MRKYKLLTILLLFILIRPNLLLSDENDSINSIFSEIVGTWYFDLDYVHTYLKYGSDLQKQWCGYSWSDDEIKKREDFVRKDFEKNGYLLIYNFSFTEANNIRLNIKNSDNKEIDKILHSCKKQNEDIYVCKQNPNMNEPFYFKFDKKYLFLVVRMTPDKMNCSLISNEPSEYWLSVVRFKKK